MNKPPAMFWSGETLGERLKTLIEPFVPGRVDCAAYTLSIGPEIYVSPNDQTADPTTVTVRKLGDGEAFTIPPGQFAFLLTEEIVSVPSRCPWPSSRSEPRPSFAASSMFPDFTSITAIEVSCNIYRSCRGPVVLSIPSR